MFSADDAMNAVEKSTRTLSGLESDSLQPTLSVDTDDSAIFTNQPFRCGNIHFEHATADLGNNVRYYVGITLLSGFVF
ncbi:hypothetical protein DPMN_159513 [Dreissena polymorpha]|uniref:Uncharacterized protein n=1 Tax=Dreissena polymorpha TaxID=45954 RepID=A0A9D4EL25_DREPO|nr:hypothetical protein DPMN_159513 [Dreissena polymorpha]